MKTKLLLILFAFFAITGGYSQSSLWTKTSEGKLNLLEKVDRDSSPKEYQLFHLNLEALKTQLSAAPSRESNEVSQVVVSFPNAEGKLERFRIYESSVMAPELAKTLPQVQSYIGQGIDDPAASMAITNTIFGLHVMTLSSKGTYYVDPYTLDHKNYIVYNKASLTTTKTFQCHTEGVAREISSEEPTVFASDSRFRTYRLAMACTIEYAAFHVAAAVAAGTLPSFSTTAQKKDAVLAAMNVTVARINIEYEKDMSLRMQLVANNRDIIFITSDSFDNTNENNALLNQSQTVIAAAIGLTNFDIGHTVSTGGGGVAQSPSVCMSSGKARGVTGLPSPVGDPYDIDFVAHEVGHQFGASHTFNGVGGNCSIPDPLTGDPGTRSATNAVEPGSGSTIMAYAGICSPVDVQSNSDSYFHAISIAQMVAHITGAGNCVAGVANGNTPPSVPALPNYTVPVGTPFVLKGSATDANGDVLTYCWEQTNPGATTDSPSATSSNSNPNFRSFAPSASPNRYFPSLATLTGNASPWEVLPNVARTMNFALTVRDNKTPSGGQTSRQNTTVTFNAAAGPFTVTSQNTDGISWTQGTTQTVTWNVANTNAAPFNTANVNILLSTDGGLTYPTVLVANTPNDGTQAFTVPNVAAPFCRIMVEAIGNIYFALNTKTFAIGYTVTNQCITYTNSTPFNVADGTGGGTAVLGPVATSVINVPTTSAITDVSVTVNGTHGADISDWRMAFAHPDGTSSIFWNFNCYVPTNLIRGMNLTFNDAGPALTCSNPATGTFKPFATFAPFLNKPANGNWTLLVADGFAANVGTINSWSVQICSAVGVLNTKNFGLADFKIYPNPNKGNFTVQFNSDSSNEIKVGVHDIRGRLILDKSFQNTGLFSENLQLSNVQAGIYMVTVQDGERKEVKKIVVE